MEMQIKSVKESITVVLGGEIDHHEVTAAKIKLDNIIMEKRPEKLIFDFSKIRFMDSSGIGLVLGRYRLLSKIGGKTIIVGTSPSILRLFKMSGIDRIIEII